VHDFDAIRRKLGLTTGLPILEQLKKLPAREAAGKYTILDEIEVKLAAGAEAQEGAGDLLELLAGRGVRMGILTRNNLTNSLATLEACGLRRFFETEAIIGRECCQPKPSPEGIFRLLDLWGVGADMAVMVGDYVFDLQAGRSAGTATVYLDKGGDSRYRQLADVSVHTLSELRRFAG